MATTKIINDLAGFNQSGSPNALKGCVGDTSEQPASSSSIDYLIVGGGAGGGGWGQAGGGGAGGYLTGSTTVYHGTPTVLTIGEGGAGGYNTSAIGVRDTVGRNGNDSGFNGLRALGGGGGGGYNDPGLGPTITYAADGASGGGDGTQGQNNNQADVGYGIALPITNPQGNNGGSTYNAAGGGYVAPYMSAGGGGAGAAGAGGLNNGTGTGNGGVGIKINDASGINFISEANAILAGIGEASSGDIWISGGGGGGAFGALASTGGLGGGNGTAAGQANGLGASGGDAMVNTGGGGGGASGYSNYSSSAGIWYKGGDGGSGFVALQYDNTAVTGYSLNSGDTYTANWPANKLGAAYWPLNLNAKDVGGYYNGTATDVTYVTGKFNQAASFNGSSSIIQGTQPAQTKNFTISAWVKTTASGAWNIAVAMGGTATHVYGLSMWISGTSNSLYGQWGNGSSEDYWATLPTTPINTGEWFHIAVTVNNIHTPTVKGYINGVLEGSGYSAGSPVAITYDPNLFTIGGRENTSGTLGYYWNGEIEQVRFYGTDLTSVDIQNIYNNSKPGSLSLLKTSSDLTTTTCNFPSGTTGTALYQFEDNTNDSCTSGPYNLTAVGSPTYVTGKFSKAISFNGTSQGATSSSAVIPTPASTISLWYNGNGTALTEFYILGVGVGSGNYGLNISYYDDGSGAHFYGGVVDNGSYQGVGTGDTIVDANEWYHIALTWDGSTNPNSMKLYLNGTLETEITPTITAASITYSPFGIGKLNHTGGSPSYAPGFVDQVRIYASVLTPQDIYDLWQKENSTQTYFADTPTAGTDTLVFKEGSGDISFTNDTTPGAELGMIRTNTDLSGAGSTSQLEYFSPGGWKTLNNSTVDICNYPTTARALYKFNGDMLDSCGNTTLAFRNAVAYTGGKFNRKGWDLPGVSINSSRRNYTGIYWPSTTGLGIDYQTEDFTISLWIKQNSFASYDACGSDSWCYGYIWSGWSKGYWTLDTAGTIYGNTIRWNTWGPGAGQTNNAESGLVELHKWYHVVATRSVNNGIKLYLNNELVASVTGSFIAGPSSYYDCMGGYGAPATSRYGLDATISQFRLFPSELNATQISQLYNEISL